MSQFQFLQAEWPDLFAPAAKAEELVHADPRTSCFYARRCLEMVVGWLYHHERSLRMPYQDHLSALIHESSFVQLVGPVFLAKAKLVKQLGNLAAHDRGPMFAKDSLVAVRELFHMCYWLARTYARTGAGLPPQGSAFDPEKLPKTSPVPPQTIRQLQQMAADLVEKDRKLVDLGSAKAALAEELEALRNEVAEAKARNTARPDDHDYSEAETRDYFIDLLLKEAGWALDQPPDREFEVAGMPNKEGKGYVDYVLWGDDGKPLAIVEAKRTKRDATVGQQQAKLYADCLEKRFGQRPLIFYSNGYEHWLWDDQFYPPRAVQGFFKKDELEAQIHRRQSRQPLAAAAINKEIVERYYQTRAIRRISESFERDRFRRALLVMATGAGKTRTVIALCDLLMRCNWAKRVLFLADRVALVKQAVNAFKAHLPASSPVNLVTEKHGQGRVFVSTYPTMMNLIDEASDGQRRFGPGHFDLVIVDEAHRSIYQKYGAIFDHFDSLLVGLTATPKDDVDRNTYRLFGLEDNVPTDVYEIEDAVRDGFLVPPRSVSVPLKFQREGIRYDELSEDEKTEWDALEWGDDEDAPDQVEADAVNKWLFNADTVDKVLKHLMTRGQKVNGGDTLGKTIIFAKNQAHAKFIAERFDRNYPHLKGAFARVITFQTEYAQTLIDDFSNPAKFPQIAISVDMLDTGIDVPEVVNLVFFKLVRSKTKFWQMLGRGTRLRKDLFGPGLHKEFFYIFDFCQNLEFFSQNPETTEGSAGESLSARLFKARLEMIGELDILAAREPDESEATLRAAIAETLRTEVAAMNPENFVVRPKRRYVEVYSKPEAWEKLGLEQHAELESEVAGLPSELVDTDIEAKRFDLLMLRLQLSVLKSEPAYAGLKERVQEIANALADKENIPMVRQQMPLIHDILTEDYWDDITAPILDNARVQLRSLVKFVEKTRRTPVYTDFEDDMGAETEIELPGLSAARFEQFKAKARAFLRDHEENPAVRKLRYDEPLGPADLDQLERALLMEGIGSEEDLKLARSRAEGFGLFLRSLAGLNRESAKRAFAQFLDGRTATANQIEFIDLIVNHLTEQGYMDPALLYESPFTDLNPLGVEGVFGPDRAGQLIGLLEGIRARAAA